MKIYNTTDSPIVIDSEGRTLGGHEHLDTSGTAQIERAMERGWIISIPEEELPAAAVESNTDDSASGDTLATPQKTARTTSKKG